MQSAVSLCGPIWQVLPKNPRPGSYPAACPVECGLSSKAPATLRLPNPRDPLVNLAGESYLFQRATSTLHGLYKIAKILVNFDSIKKNEQNLIIFLDLADIFNSLERTLC